MVVVVIPGKANNSTSQGYMAKQSIFQAEAVCRNGADWMGSKPAILNSEAAYMCEGDTKGPMRK